MENLMFEVIDRIAIIKINRPKALNALNKLVVDEIDNAIEQIKNNSEIRVLVIGSINNFAAGADIKDMVSCNEDEAKSFSFSKTFQKIADLEIPTIASIDGYALGGGLELALACDFRIVTDTAKVGFPEINLGIMPGAGGTIRTPRLIGESRAKELMLFGDIIDSYKAENIGLVNKVVEKESLMDITMEWAKKLSKKAPIAISVAKNTIEMGMCEPHIKDAIKIEDQNWAKLFNTVDQKEGMKSFIEKRKPNYIGK